MVLGILWWVRRVPVLVFAGIGLLAAEVPWKQLSTAENDLPMPSTAKLHAGTVVADFDRDGTNDIVVAFGDAAPALVLLHGGTNWMRLPIELEFLPLAAGGAAVDIDQDKDADLVFGSAKGSELWWWENPAPEFDPNKSWVRRLITDEGGTGYGEILFTDVIGSIRPQLVYWNRGSNSLHFAEIPASPRLVSNWVTLQIFSAPLPAGELPSRMGLADADINIDGRGDLLAGNFWLQRSSGRNFEATRIGDAQGLALAGRFRPRTYPHLVVAPTGGPGPLRWYEALTDPGVPRSWAGRDLLSHEISPAGTLALADFDGNGHEDILVAELARLPSSRGVAAPAHRAWIVYSDGKGNFTPTLFATGIELFQAKVADLDADGDPDIVSTPRTHMAPRVDIWLNQRAEPAIVTGATGAPKRLGLPPPEPTGDLP